jgi:hypothetical protein
VIDGKQSGADEDGELAIALYRNDEIPTMAAPTASVLARVRKTAAGAVFQTGKTGPVNR